MKLSTFPAAVAVMLALATASQPAAAAGAKAKPKPLPAQKMQAPASRPATPVQDQSYLFLNGPKEGRGAPDYVTAGMKHSNQPYFMSRFDRLGNWP